MMIWYGAIIQPGNIGVSDRGLDRLALDIIYTPFLSLTNFDKHNYILIEFICSGNNVFKQNIKHFSHIPFTSETQCVNHFLDKLKL